MFITDDWEGFHRLIPKGQLFTGKDLTFPIEQDNSNIRRYLARFRRRTKVVSKCPIMVDPSLRLHHHLRDPKNHAALAAIFLSIADSDSRTTCHPLPPDWRRPRDISAAICE